MQIFVEKVENPNQEFWIWKKKITNRQTEGIYPSTVSNAAPASVQRFTKRMRLVMLLKSRSYSSLITKSWSSTILPEKRSI